MTTGGVVAATDGAIVLVGTVVLVGTAVGSPPPPGDVAVGGGDVGAGVAVRVGTVCWLFDTAGEVETRPTPRCDKANRSIVDIKNSDQNRRGISSLAISCKSFNENQR